MPRRDGTGPMGRGSMTGRGMGPCCNANDVGGRGLGLGLACRRGFGRRGNFNNITDSKNEKELLREQKEILEHKLNLINEQLNDL